VNISQLEVEQLLQLMRDLTVRVHRLEGLLHVQAPQAQAAEPAPAPPSPATPAVIQGPPPLQVTSATPVPPPPMSRGSVPERVPIEARIGSHWFNRIGIAAVLIGVSLLLKLAFDNNWVGPAGRIAIGLVAGIVVVLWSERFRSRGYRMFSYSLKAVGIGVLYLSLWASFQVYQLMPSGAVFVCMLISP
jgi:uncharacterized membrane protein